jgi:hypothetical protein
MSIGKRELTYDATRDVYHCPQRQLLPRRKTKHTEATEAEVVYRTDVGICNVCTVKAACTASN